jgi:pullulanase/glycogen debranching enzyme
MLNGGEIGEFPWNQVSLDSRTTSPLTPLLTHVQQTQTCLKVSILWSSSLSCPLLTWLSAWQGGNNNTYCHDSPLNWFNWTQAEEDKSGFARFFRLLVNLRLPQSHPDSPDKPPGKGLPALPASVYMIFEATHAAS